MLFYKGGRAGVVAPRAECESFSFVFVFRWHGFCLARIVTDPGLA